MAPPSGSRPPPPPPPSSYTPSPASSPPSSPTAPPGSPPGAAPADAARLARLDRRLLVVGLCLVSAATLGPRAHWADLRGDAEVTAACWIAMLILFAAAAAALLRRRALAGTLMALVVILTNGLALTPFTIEGPPRFLFAAQEAIWGVTPPLLLAVWHLAFAEAPTGALTWFGAAAWVLGFAVKFLQVRSWRL